MKDNPNYMTTRQVYERLNCGRTNVQKLEAAGKLHRAGVESGCVYYPTHEVVALEDEQDSRRVEKPQRYEAQRYEPAKAYLSSGPSFEAELRREDRAFVKNIEATWRPPQEDSGPVIAKQLEGIRKSLGTYFQDQSDAQRRAERKAASDRADLPLFIGYGLLACGLGYACWRTRQEAKGATARMQRELELHLKRSKGTLTEAEAIEYAMIRWHKQHANDPVSAEEQHEFELDVKMLLGILTEAEASEYAGIVWRQLHPAAKGKG